MTTAAIKEFRYIYKTPILLLAILYLDCFRMVKKEALIGMYAIVVLMCLSRYLSFMIYVINKMLDYLDLSLLKVKPVPV